MAFSAFSLWGFVNVTARGESGRRNIFDSGLFWLAAGLVGMLFVSPVVALATLILFGGWMYFIRAGRPISWWGIGAALVVFVLGLFLLSSALNRSGEFDSSSPLHVVSDWLKLAVQWDVYQLERGSGWVQKLFDEMPEWLRLPFVMTYGLFQPVLPAALVEPTTLIWRVIGILRAAGWYAMLPVLVLSFLSAWNDKESRLWLWLNVVVWGWILFASMRGGGDQWDNPRYRTILFLWEAILAGHALVWLRKTRSVWLGRVFLMEAIFILFFSQWYANRYYHIGGQMPFAQMVIVIFALWAMVFFWGIWRDRKTAS